MRFLLIMGCLALGACHGATSTDTGGNAAAGAADKAAAGAEGSADCPGKPDFAPVYPGAVIRLCSTPPAGMGGPQAGNVLYTTSATPEQVLAYVKDQTAKAGLSPSLSTANMFSASKGVKRTTMTHVEVKDGATHVVLNWAATD